MIPNRVRDKVREMREYIGRQRGFTLIELVAVMAILAILVAIVAPAATNTQQASVRAQAQGDSQQVKNAANDFYKDQNKSEVRIPHTISTTADMTTLTSSTSKPSPTQLGNVDDNVFSTDNVVSARQEVSTKWPEIYITNDGAPALTDRSVDARGKNARYSEVFQTASTNTLSTSVDKLILLDKKGYLINGKAFLETYTAIDLTLLQAKGYLSELPAGVDHKSTAGSDLEVPNFLWVFEKTDSSGGTGDAREVQVFQLQKIDRDEGPDDENATATVDLTYRQIQ